MIIAKYIYIRYYDGLKLKKYKLFLSIANADTSD